MMKSICRMTLVLLLLINELLPVVSNAQLNYAGKQFFLSLAPNPSAPNWQITITSKHHAAISFLYSTVPPWQTSPISPVQNYNVSPGEVLCITFNQFQLDAISGTGATCGQVNNHTLQITSDSNIVVHLLNREGAADDGTPILPSDNQMIADEFMLIQKYKTNEDMSGVNYQLIASCDSTLIEIIPSDSIRFHSAQVPFTVMLNKGEGYQLCIPGSTKDISGTRIRVLHSLTPNPLNIFCQQFDYNYPHPVVDGDCCADWMLEQLLPVNYWQNTFPVMRMLEHSDVTLKILSPANNNNVYFDNVLVRTMNSGEYFDTVTDHAMVVRSDSQLAITEYMMSSGLNTADGLNGDPDMLWNLSLSQGVKDSYFRSTGPNYISPSGFAPYRMRLNMVSKSSNIASIQLNGNPVASYFYPFPYDPSYSYAHIPIDSTDTVQVYHLVSSEKVIAYFCKTYVQGGYSFNLGDMDVDSIAEYSNLIVLADTVYKCRDQQVSLTATGTVPYEWSTGNTGMQISVTDTGMYWVRCIKEQSCSKAPVLQYYHVIDTTHSILDLTISDTLMKCPEAAIPLWANNAVRYEWSTGDTTKSIISFLAPGTYWVKEYKQGSVPCFDEYDYHTFYVVDYQVGFDIGNDTAACMGDSVLLYSRYSSTVWSSGDIGRYMIVHTEGFYSAVYTDSCGQQHTDSIYVAFHECPERFCIINFPSAFSPNQDGRNDQFRPVKHGSFDGYYLAVYDRWGKKLFQSYDINEGWNGCYPNGTLAELGVYMYMCQVRCPLKGTLLLKGDITLVR